MDALATGRRIKCLTCVDDFTKECLTITTAWISGVKVTRILDSISLFRGYPATLTISAAMVIMLIVYLRVSQGACCFSH